MSKLTQYCVGTAVLIAGAMITSAASAGNPVPLTVPEPGLFGIIAAGAAAVIVAARLRKDR